MYGFNNQVSRNVPQNPYKEFTLVIPAAANGLNRQRINYATSYFRVIALTLATLSINTAGAAGDTSVVGAGIGIELDEIVPWIELINTGASDLTVTVAMGICKIQDSRLTLTGTVTTSVASGATLSDVADVAVLTTATTKVNTGSATYKSVIISNLLANAGVVRVGTSSAGAARGAEIPIGGSVTLDTQADVYIYNPNAGTVNIGVLRVVA